MGDTTAARLDQAEIDRLNEMVAEADTGGRKPTGLTGRIVFCLALAWSLFQLWYSSPIPYALNFGIVNDAFARPIHLAFALALVMLTFPAGKRSSRTSVPLLDWLLALAGAGAALYLIVFYNDLIARPGLPTRVDIGVSIVGVLVLLEAARRAVGPAITVIAALMLVYIFAGPYMPGLLAHGGASLSRAASQMWLTSEGIFGVALGVSTNVVFMFVLFGTLLERAGAGGYFIQLAFSLLGHYRGGPAKAGVVASGLTGMISGSSIANVVTTGTFTIPLMKRVGYSAVKAGAIECAAGVNGQIMPPVMGAAAFLIAEYVGISYAEVVKHAFFPAILTYGSLFYIVDIEAQKMGLKGLPSSRSGPLLQGVLRAFMGVSGFVILCGLVYYGIGWIKLLAPDLAIWIICAGLLCAYVGLVASAARYPDLKVDDPDTALIEVPRFGETARTGLHFILPVVLLIWCLMVEQLSPGLSAFWGSAALIFLLVTQRPLLALFRGQSLLPQVRRGMADLLEGLSAAARNMTSVGIATGTAGIIVGTVLLTGIGLVMTEIVAFISGGSLIGMLLLTALICIILGMGMPTTASYVVVATLMAPVIVDLAAQNDLAVPLVAVHLFVFYFGLMADVTPPVGLAAYAAAAISGADPVKTGFQGFAYEIRTALLPFIFIFNNGLLMIGINGPVDFILMVMMSSLAMIAFVAATQGWFLVRNRWYETMLLIITCLILFRPGFLLDQVYTPTVQRPASDAVRIIESLPGGGTLRMRVSAMNLNGDDVEKLVRLELGEGGRNAAERLRETGLSLLAFGGKTTIGTVRLGSQAAKLGLQQGDTVIGLELPAERPSAVWFQLPGVLLLALLYLVQSRRKPKAQPSGRSGEAFKTSSQPT